MAERNFTSLVKDGRKRGTAAVCVETGRNTYRRTKMSFLGKENVRRKTLHIVAP